MIWSGRTTNGMSRGGSRRMKLLPPREWRSSRFVAVTSRQPNGCSSGGGGDRAGRFGNRVRIAPAPVRKDARGGTSSAGESGRGGGFRCGPGSGRVRHASTPAERSVTERSPASVLVVDDSGLVIDGMYHDASGVDRSAEIGAHLGGLGTEASRALAHLGLGAWRAMHVETPTALVALAPAPHDTVVLLAAPRATPLGLMRQLLETERRRIAALGATQ